MEVATYIEVMLSIMAIALSVLLAGVTLLAICEAVEWAVTRKRTAASAKTSIVAYERGNALS
jgi:hypothetical protein